VLVSGEAGVGKTRLGEELARFAGELPGARVLWGRCAPYGEGRDLAAVAEMVRTACGISESDDVDTARARVSRTVARLEHPAYAGPVPAAMAERLRSVLGLEEAEAPGPRDAATPGAMVGGDQARRAIAALWTALAAEGPLVLLLDDLHWATPAMIEGLQDVAGRTKGPVLLLALGRPDMLGIAGEGWWERLGDAELLPVLPLEETAAERLLKAYLGSTAGELDDAVRTALLSRAQGNPFFLAELLHLLVDRGALVREGDRWVLGADVPDDLLPAGVQSVLAARIDGLDGAAKGVLRDASVIGTHFSLPMLEAVGRASGHGAPDVVRTAVATLVERRLLEADADAQRLRFGHTLVRDVAYAGLAKAERARRHAAAAEYAHGVSGGRSSEADAVAASQGERAVRLAAEMGLPYDDPAWQARGIAFAALARLGSAALSRDENANAQRLLARAIDLTSPAYGAALPDDLVVPVRVSYAQALAALHRLVEAEEQLTTALTANEEGIRAAALVVVGDVRRRRGDLTGATQAFVSALAAASTAGLDRISGEALRQLGLIDYFDGRLRAAEERFRSAHQLAVQVGDDRGAGWALQHLAWSATTRGDYALADETLELAAEVFTSLEDTGGLSWVAGTEGFVRLLQGRLVEARDLAGSLLPLGDAMGERWGVAALLTIDALAAAELGDIAAATDEATRARERFEEVGDAWGQTLALTAAGIAARGADQPEDALALLDAAAALAEKEHFPMTQSLALVAGGYASLDCGDVNGAEGRAWRASAVLAALDLEPHATLGAKVLLAQAMRIRGQREQALAELDAALAVSDQPGLLFPRRQALAHRAGTLLELGRVDEGLAAAREAVGTHAEDVRSRVLALRALGSALKATGDLDGARSSYDEALAVATSTGQRSEIAATEALIAALD
jgi:tetratricopeptide (TPR) repeat protein